MFLALMILLQNSLPCTENFYRYQKNFEKYVSTEETKEDENGGTAKEEKKKIIASPKMISKLSPMASLARKEGVNFNPPSSGKLLQYAVNKQKTEEGKDGPEEETKAVLDEKGVPS